MKLALGTVQFGMKYGIQGHDQPDGEQALAILNKAYASGIEIFDTSAVYGTAEDILKQFLQQPHMVANSVRVISKFSGNIEQIEYGIQESLTRLGLEELDGYLLHDANQVFNDQAIQALIRLKKYGLTKNIGVSVYTPKQAFKALEYKEIDMIQVPYNLFDRRLDKEGFFQETKKQPVTVLARSILLQGLLTMKVNELPASLQAAKPYLMELERLCQEEDCTRLEAALQFVHTHEGIDVGIIGVDTLQQLQQILSLFKKKRNDRLISRLSDAFDNVDEKVIDPTGWNKK